MDSQRWRFFGCALKSLFMEVFINGISRGAIYALVALGYTMVYGILGMINFAHGEIFMIGMFAGVYALGVLTALLGDHLGWNLSLAFILAAFLAAAYGYANERIAYRKLRRANILAPLTSAIGLSIVLQNFIMLAVSKEQLNFPTYYSRYLVETKLWHGAISLLQLGILVVAIVLMIGLFWLIHRTKIGIAMRATAQDQMMASLVGISVNSIIAWTFILGSGLAAVAGMMVAMYQGTLKFDSGYLYGLKAFTAAVLGGIGNIPGAVLGGFLLGFTEDLTTTSKGLGSEWKNITTFIILMVVLVVRPRGLLGERVAEKV